MNSYDLILSKLVGAGLEEHLMVTPDSGKNVRINIFHGSGASQPYAVVKLVWDLDGDDEELLWTVKTNGDLPTEIVIPKADVDGVKKLSMCLENSGSDDIYLSAFASVSEF